MNPLACDTPDGMLRWWLFSANARSIETVTAALAWMKRRGLVEELPAADGRIRFRRVDGAFESTLRRLAAGFDLDDGMNGTLH